MQKSASFIDPILSCAESIKFEKNYFSNSGVSEWDAMAKAGKQVGQAILTDFKEIPSANATNGILILLAIGKGHNGGDALIAAKQMIESLDGKQVDYDLMLACPREELKPNTEKALALLISQKPPKNTFFYPATIDDKPVSLSHHYDIMIDGLLGMQFKAPLKGAIKSLIEVVNSHPSISLRASVDLPSGLGDESASNPIRADFTYGTGIVKVPAISKVHVENVGRLRYIDLGFFDNESINKNASEIALATTESNSPADSTRLFQNQSSAHFSIVKDEILNPLRKLRKVNSEKRSYGKVALLGGCLQMPGAIMMASASALCSGCGLVKTFMPAPSISPFLAQWPEIMAYGYEVGSDGLLDENPIKLLENIQNFADVLVVGPGLGRSPKVTEILKILLPELEIPIVMDADALLPDVLDSRLEKSWKSPAVVITPHLGEFKRLLSIKDKFLPNHEDCDLMLRDYCQKLKITAVLKGAQSRISNGENNIWINPTGGPILARGGSGDLLSGMIGSCIAQSKARTIMQSTAMAVYWHGKAADCMARGKGATAVRTTELFHYYPEAMHS